MWETKCVEIIITFNAQSSGARGNGVQGVLDLYQFARRAEGGERKGIARCVHTVVCVALNGSYMIWLRRNQTTPPLDEGGGQCRVQHRECWQPS